MFGVVTIDPLSVILQSHILYRDMKITFGSNDNVQQQQVPSWVSWPKPPVGVVFLNLDGSEISNPVPVGFGACLEIWMADFFVAIMVC